ncbi:MAG TPA: GDSL-type esterase/lipase family protein [Pirellula sp.]|nr:GDSL-type esterase/lipase family protein [Pirellula sp.]
MNISLAKQFSIGLIVLMSTIVFVPLVFSQEKTSKKTTSLHFIEKHDLGKYATDAAKWDKDVNKLAAKNATDGGEDFILCLGSSSFRLWSTISDDLAPYQIVNRAYGGAKYCDLAIHTPKLIEDLRFRAAMIFVGNDITGREMDKTPDEIVRLSKIVMDVVRTQRPNAPVFLIAVTPSPSRFQHWTRIIEANQSLEKLASKEANTFFVATQNKYLNQQGEPRSELFVKDMLHQNKDGYAIWSSILKDSLGRNLR